jgi:hypothetical protein
LRWTSCSDRISIKSASIRDSRFVTGWTTAVTRGGSRRRQRIAVSVGMVGTLLRKSVRIFPGGRGSRGITIPFSSIARTIGANGISGARLCISTPRCPGSHVAKLMADGFGRKIDRAPLFQIQQADAVRFDAAPPHEAAPIPCLIVEVPPVTRRSFLSKPRRHARKPRRGARRWCALSAS